MDQFDKEVKMDQQNNKQTNEINLLSMIESRIMEIIQIEDECKKKLPKMFQQRLPRFMRRRAASHNPKRIPKYFRPSEKSEFGTKSRKSLLKYRRSLRFRKHKRILKRHAKHKYNEPFKCSLHKWFAKRFKMCHDSAFNYVPLFNNTKNQRNLYRQSIYGCAFLSMAHLISIQIKLNRANLDDELTHLNKLTAEISGFTFSAQALVRGTYEIAIHMYKPGTNQYICPAFVNLQGLNRKQTKKEAEKHEPSCELTLWVPRNNYQEIQSNLTSISTELAGKMAVTVIYPKDCTRVRLIGQHAFDEAVKIAENKSRHKKAIEDVKMKLNLSFGSTIGRYIEDKVANFTYYFTKPLAVDIVFKGIEGRMLWHNLVKNKAHLVGGFRDLSRLLIDDCFKVNPDNEV